jgi:hypothetical protein
MYDPAVVKFLPTLHQKGAIAALAIVALWWIFSLVRSRKMREEHALLWIGGIATGLLVVVTDPVLLLVTSALGVKIPASALILLTLLFLMGACVRLTSLASTQKQQIANLAIELSLLKARVEGQLEDAQPANEDADEAH